MNKKTGGKADEVQKTRSEENESGSEGEYKCK